MDNVEQIEAGLLNVGYVDAGPADGPAVLLLHGWPYDIHSYEEVAPLLASKGYRVIVPYLRGYGTTRFLSSETFRNAQQSAVALDIVKLMLRHKVEIGHARILVMGLTFKENCPDIRNTKVVDLVKELISLAGEVENLAAQYCAALALGDVRILDEADMCPVLDKFRTYGKQDAADSGLTVGGTLRDAAPKGSRP